MDLGPLGDFGEVIIALGVSLVFMVGGSLFFRTKRDPHMEEVFFPDRAPSTTAAVYEFEQGSYSRVSDSPITRRRSRESDPTRSH